MNNYNIFLFSIFFLVNFLFFNNLNFLARKINIFDVPDGVRKLHKTKVPLLGGLLIVINIILFLLIFNKEITSFEKYKNILLINSYYYLFIYILTFFTLFLIGLFDDKYQVQPLKKILFFFLIFFILIIFDETLYIKSIIFSFSDFKILLGKSASLLTILCIMLAIVSQNMFDGVNLQAGLFYLFLSIFFIFKGISPELFSVISLFLIIFLYYNYKNKIFLGDSGVYVLSFITSFAFIKSYSLNFMTIYFDQIFCYLFLPIIDSFRVCITRIFLGKSPFFGDRSHFHHLLLKKFSIVKYYAIIIFLLLLPFFWINFFKFSTPLLIFAQFFIYFFLLYRSTNK